MALLMLHNNGSIVSKMHFCHWHVLNQNTSLLYFFCMIQINYKAWQLFMLMILFAQVQRLLRNKYWIIYKKVFEIGKTAETLFKYIGLNISYHTNHIETCQKDYADSTKYITISQQRKSEKFHQLNSDEAHILRSVIGQAT